MKFKVLMVTSTALLTSCTWMGNQSHDFMQWADRTMPTYDGSHPGVENNNNGAMIPDHYNGYPYAANASRTPMNAPGVSGANTPPLPGQGIMANPGMTPAQAASAAEGGNSRPRLSAPPMMNNYNSAPSQPMYGNVPPPPPAYPSSQNMPASYGNSMGERRMPANQLPPSAIKPVPYGALHQNRQDDFPTEYSKPSSPGMDSSDNMVPPPPI